MGLSGQGAPRTGAERAAANHAAAGGPRGQPAGRTLQAARPQSACCYGGARAAPPLPPPPPPRSYKAHLTGACAVAGACRCLQREEREGGLGGCSSVAAAGKAIHGCRRWQEAGWAEVRCPCGRAGERRQGHLRVVRPDRQRGHPEGRPGQEPGSRLRHVRPHTTLLQQMLLFWHPPLDTPAHQGKQARQPACRILCVSVQWCLTPVFLLRNTREASSSMQQQ